MKTIPIFKAEASVEGLADKIRSNCSVAYEMPLEIVSSLSDSAGDVLKSIAAENDEDGLFFVKSVLVTTDWNRNDDVFIKEETWPARHSARKKPTNVEHNEDEIIGHILDTWTIDRDGKHIPDDAVLDDIPDVFHVCTASVIYTIWEKPENQERADTLVAAIKNGEKYVSMECLFSNFDYAAIGPDKKKFVISRNEESAFLTKHLRCYGGSGEYRGHRIGRVLKNITFSGKGYVSKPANPNSVIFNKSPVFDSVVGPISLTTVSNNLLLSNNGVLLNEQHVAAHLSSNQETSNMSSELELLQTQLTEAKEQLDEATRARTEVEQRLADVNVAQYEAKIEELQKEVAAQAAANADLVSKSEELQSTINDLSSVSEEITKSRDELSAELERVQIEKLQASRVATLVDGGISKKEAETKVSTFANLDDDQFAALAEELIKAAQAPTLETETETASEDTGIAEEEIDTTEASEETLEEVETEEASAGIVSEEEEVDEADSARSSIANFVASEYLHIELTDDEVNGD